MKILITGCSGFVGKHLLECLSYKDKIDIFATVRKPLLELEKKANIIYTDLTLEKDWVFLNGIDIVIHLAATQHHTGKKNANNLFQPLNIESTKELIQNSIYYNVKKFIFISTIQVYGENFSKNYIINEDTALKAKSIYSKSKLNGEIILQNESLKSDMSFIIIRSPLIYGKEAKGNLEILKNLIVKGIPLPLANIKNKRHMIHVENLSNFICECAFNKQVNNEIFVVSDNKAISTSDLIYNLGIELNKKVYLFYFPKLFLCLLFIIIGKKDLFLKLTSDLNIDISKALTKTNWKPLPNTILENKN